MVKSWDFPPLKGVRGMLFDDAQSYFLLKKGISM